jgi:hypothetical protein
VPAPCAAAEPVYTVLHGGDSDGITHFLDDLSRLWDGSNPGAGSVLASRIEFPAAARLQALRRSQVAFAIVDADTFARRRASYPDLAAVAVLWPEALQVLARRVETTPLTAVPAGDLLVADNATFGALALANANPATHWLLLAHGGLVAGLQRKPLPLLLASGFGALPEVDQALKNNSDLRPVPLAKTLIDSARGQSPWMLAATLPAGTYTGQAQSIDTLAVYQVLVTRADAPTALVQHALAALYRWQDRMGPANPRFAAIDRKSNTPAAAWFPFHAASQKEFGLAPPAQ